MSDNCEEGDIMADYYKNNLLMQQEDKYAARDCPLFSYFILKQKASHLLTRPEIILIIYLHGGPKIVSHFRIIKIILK